MALVFFLISASVSMIYNVAKYSSLDNRVLPPRATSLVVPTKPDQPGFYKDRTGFDARVRVFTALFDQPAFEDSFGAQVSVATAPAIAAFNAFGECIGVANTFWNLDDDNRIENGAHRDFTIRQTAGPGQQISYLQVYATGTPICIPGITMTMADNTPGAFSGDFGRACGAAWYYSNIVLGSDHQPDCFWLDSGVRNERYTYGEECKRLKKQCAKFKNNCMECDENDKTLQYQFPAALRYLPKAMQFTISTFSQTSDPGAAPPSLETLCGEASLTFRHLLHSSFEFRPNMHSEFDRERNKVIPAPKSNPSFKTDNVTLFQLGSDLIPEEKRSLSAAEASSHSATHAWKFYVSSSSPEHSALKLCASITSLGPDFYSESERKFCDMGLPGTGSRKMYDVCDERRISPCWDLATHQLSSWVKNKKKRSSSSKMYTHKVEWQSDGNKNVVKLQGYAGRMGPALNGTKQAPTPTVR